MQPYTGYVNAVCPTCKEIVRSESVTEKDVGRVRDLLRQISEAYRHWLPFAKVKVFDPVHARRR